jgi:hypothetical protein
MLQVNNVDMSPRQLLQNSAAPHGPIPPPPNAQGGAERPRAQGASLIQQTINQVNAGQVNGVGGRVDLLG